jgi:putative NADH-flavin reductase
MVRLQRSLAVLMTHENCVWCHFNPSTTFQPADNRVNWKSGTVQLIATADVTSSIPGLHGSVVVGCCVDHVGRDVTVEMT